MDMIRFYQKYRDFVRKICMFVVYVSSAGIPLILFFQAIFRYVVKKPLLGLEEIAVLLMVMLTIFGSVVLFFEKKHIIVDTFIVNMPEKSKKMLNLVNEIILIVIIAYLIKSGLLAIPLQKVYKSVILGIPQTFTTSIFVLTLFILFLDSVMNIIIAIENWRVTNVEK